MENNTTVVLPELLTVAEVAERLRVSTETVRRRIGDGSIAAVRFGHVIRIPASELDRLLDDVAASRR